jgi:hypothetical protein
MLTTVCFLLSDLIDTDITNCHIVSNAYWGHFTTPSLPRTANTTVFIHSVLANKLSLALKVTEDSGVCCSREGGSREVTPVGVTNNMAVCYVSVN